MRLCRLAPCTFLYPLLTPNKKYCDENTKAEPAFMYVLHAFYDIDVLEEDAILEWAQALQGSEGPEKRFVQQVTNEICAVNSLSFLFPT